MTSIVTGHRSFRHELFLYRSAEDLVEQCREVKNHRTLQHIEYTANLRLDTLTAYSTRPPLRIRLPTRAA
jgi:hypothetical protein